MSSVVVKDLRLMDEDRDKESIIKDKDLMSKDEDLKIVHEDPREQQHWSIQHS